MEYTVTVIKVFSVIRLRRKFIVLTLCMAAVFLLSLLAVSIPAASEKRLIPIYSVSAAEKKIALSFNCAEKPDDLDLILDILDSHNIKATFFPLGIWAQAYPQSLRRISELGHEIGNHSFSHADCAAVSRDEVYSQIVKCNQVISEITGKSPVLFRCPSGSYDNKTIEAARSAGMTVIQWSVDSVDWRNNSSDEIYDRVVPKTSPGDIIQFHIGTAGTAGALDRIITDLSGKGYEFVSVGELIYPEPYTVDHAGVQSPLESVTDGF